MSNLRQWFFFCKYCITLGILQDRTDSSADTALEKVQFIYSREHHSAIYIQWAGWGPRALGRRGKGIHALPSCSLLFHTVHIQSAWMRREVCEILAVWHHTSPQEPALPSLVLTRTVPPPLHIALHLRASKPCKLYSASCRTPLISLSFCFSDLHRHSTP